MSLALKSNNVASKSMGNVNGIMAAQDWSLFLDFENGEYTKKITGTKTQLTESQVLSCTSNKVLASNPMTQDRFGNKSVITAANQLRWWKTDNRFGLLVEDSQTNWFLNSSSPVTQNIANIPSGSLMVASCIGSGSLIVSGDGITTTTVTEKTPFAIPTVSSIRSINIEVVGNLTHAQLIRAAGFATLHTPIYTNSGSRSSGADLVEVNQSLISELIDKTKPITIIFQTLPVANVIDPRTTYNESRIALETPTLNAVFGLTKYTDISLSNRLVSSFKSDSTYQYTGSGVVQNVADIGLTNTQVIQITADGVTASMNGGALFKPSPVTGLEKFTRIKLASPVISPVHQAGNCIFTKLVIFNRLLTDQEILEVSKSWI